MISRSDAIIAILTKDAESKRDNKTIHLSNPNVTDEIGQGRDLVPIILVEDGVEVPSNIQTRYTYTKFSRNNLAEMLLTLMESLKSSGFT